MFLRPARHEEEDAQCGCAFHAHDVMVTDPQSRHSCGFATNRMVANLRYENVDNQLFTSNFFNTFALGMCEAPRRVHGMEKPRRSTRSATPPQAVAFSTT